MMKLTVPTSTPTDVGIALQRLELLERREHAVAVIQEMMAAWLRIERRDAVLTVADLAARQERSRAGAEADAEAATTAADRLARVVVEAGR